MDIPVYLAAPAADPAADFLAGDLAVVPDMGTPGGEPVQEMTMPTDSPVDLSAEFAELDNQNVEVMNEGMR